MKTAKLKEIELEYEEQGTGEAVLLIGPGPIADSLLPLFDLARLNRHYRMIRYHQRGQCGSTRSPGPVTFAQHAADAAALLDHLDLRAVSIVGHSTGGDIALELAAARPDLVCSLILLEPALMNVPSGPGFLQRAQTAITAYAAGDHRAAMAAFLTVACSLDWATCRSVIDRHIPGGVAQAIKDADTFFGNYLPALGSWQFGAEQAAAISQPVLSVLGTNSDQLFQDGRSLLSSWFPQMQACTIEGAAHLLQLEQPELVGGALADFLALHARLEHCA